MRFALLLLVLPLLTGAFLCRTSALAGQQVAERTEISLKVEPVRNSTSIGQTNSDEEDVNDNDQQDSELPELKCPPNESQLDELGNDCLILKLYNQSQIDSLARDQLFRLTEFCACQLARMDRVWEESFFDTPATKRVAGLVVSATKNSSRPIYLWSDADVSLYGVSIYTATNDFFEQQARNKSMIFNANLRRRLERDEIWTTIRSVCRRIARDPSKLYRYLENLNRANPNAFYKLIYHSESAEIVYLASKACKVLMMLKLRFYKLRPDDQKLVPVDYDAFSSTDLAGNHSEESITFASQHENELQLANNIDHMLKDSSALLIKCSSWQRRQSSIQDLARECPMMMSEQFPRDWMRSHPSKWQQTQVAIKCGCQLLMHKQTWSKMMEDKNVKTMSKALTDYLNRNRVPHFASTPIFAIHGWFEYIMAKFVKNRKMSIKEMVKAMSNSQDPLVAINRATGDSSEALERMRVGCNYIMFNYNKGSPEAASELKLIRYLTNLQAISQDPMYVFHLTLQDPNLFKLNALSKMCEPFVK